MWRVRKATVRDVHAELAAQRPLAYTTVLTVMGNLSAKGLLTKTADGRAHTYSVTMTEQEFVARECKRAVSEVLNRFGDLAVASFLDQSKPVSAEALRILREYEQSTGGSETPMTSGQSETAEDGCR
jgi:predicted transcriptional regulator